MPPRFARQRRQHVGRSTCERLERNRARDRLVNRELRKRGWRVIRIWEHALRRPAMVAARVRSGLSLDTKS